MRFGIETPPQHCTWHEMLDVFGAADEIPLFESAWNSDPFQPPIGDAGGPRPESWVTLSALAARTRRIRSRAGLSCWPASRRRAPRS